LFYRLENVVTRYERLFSHDVHDQDVARQMQVTFKKQVQEWKDLLLRGKDPAMIQKYSSAFEKESANVQRLARELKQDIDSERAGALLDHFIEAHQVMAQTYAGAARTFTRSKGAAQTQADAAVKGQDRAPTDLIDSLVAALVTETEERRAAISADLWKFAVVSGFGFLLFAVLAYRVVRSINRQLALNVAELRERAQAVAQTAAQISASGQSQAEDASKQAGSLEETSVATIEATAMIHRNSESASASAGLMARMESRVQGTSQSLAATLDAMENIKLSSGKIAKIIRSIDEIAFQTNILALNAAVEAARAGEAGLGFAVVADEVRNLAQRSTRASQDTALLIKESIALSSASHAQVGSLAEAIRLLADDASTVRGLVDQVSAGSQHQNRAMDAVSASLREIDQVTQRAAAGAEEDAATAEELKSQAEALNEVVARLSAMLGAYGE
jgi:methyl-accepting chemotaxis protein/methyl-accepting chemotaxis protein-1 (serine sensor receptor)